DREHHRAGIRFGSDETGERQVRLRIRPERAPGKIGKDFRRRKWFQIQSADERTRQLHLRVTRRSGPPSRESSILSSWSGRGFAIAREKFRTPGEDRPRAVQQR